MKRSDAHAKGAIIPADYSYVMSYHLATTSGGWPVPSFGVNCAIDHQVTKHDAAGNLLSVTNGEHAPDGRCCILEMKRTQKMAAHGGTGKCSICGSAFVYGDIWEHTPSGELIHVGHTCSDKYQLLADRSAYEMKLGRLRGASAVAMIRAENDKRRTEFLLAHPNLAEALAMDHNILRDLGEKFVRFCSLSEKQVALAFKLADEIKNPKAAEIHVAAPVSDKRITIRGIVVSTKNQETNYGTILRMTVKVQTPAGSWLAWGTCPNAIAVEQRADGRCFPIGRGDEVEFSAMLRPGGREDFFSFFSRPTKARIVARAQEVVPEAAPVLEAVAS